MIYCEFMEGSGLGNQLWIYTVTRLIAEHKGTDFSVLSPEKFKARHFIPLLMGVSPKNIENHYTERNEIFEGNSMHPFDPELYNIPDNTKIDGNFQSYQYIRGHEDKIRSWFNFKRIKPRDNICVVHVRMGDFIHTDVFLPREYYETAMAKMKEINPDVEFVVISDQPELAKKYLGLHKMIGDKSVDPVKADHHFGGNIAIDFSVLANAEYLIIPNSSFAWWGAFLNTRKKAVIAPMYWAGRNKGYWQTKDIQTDGFIYV